MADKLDLTPGKWLGPKGRRDAKRVTGITFVVRRDPDSLYGIEARAYIERTRSGLPPGPRFYRKSYDGMHAFNLARKLDISLRGTTLSVFPYLGEGAGRGVPLRRDFVGYPGGSNPWQYTMTLEFNSLPKSARVWDPDREQWVHYEDWPKVEGATG